MQRSALGLLALLVPCLGTCTGPGNVIARLLDGVDAAQIAADFNVLLLDTTPGAPFALFYAPIDMEITEDAMRLDARVVWAEDDDECRMPEHDGAGKASTIGSVSSDQQFYSLNQGPLAQIGWSAHTPSHLLTVAILDTGLSPTHASLWARVTDSANFVEPGQPAYDLALGVDTTGNGIADEGAGHGTMVAGIMAMMAPDTRLVVVRVADSDGVGNAWTLLCGVAFAVTSGARVANISFGLLNREIPAFEGVLNWAKTNNLLIVAAAGNNDTPGNSHELASYPAAYDKAVSVTGVGLDDKKSPYANWDRTVDVAAPSDQIVSFYLDGEWAKWSGTSFGAPITAAAIANTLGSVGYRKTSHMIELLQNGVNIDGLNPPMYSGKIGRRLDCGQLLADVVADSDYGTIAGQINLQYRLLQPDTLDIDVSNANGPLGTFSVIRSGNGTYHLSLPKGLVTATTKPFGFLRKTLYPSVPNQNVVTVDFDLINGDVDDDNMIGLYDLNLLFLNFDSAHPVTDLDGDGAVDIFDLTIMVAGFGLLGDP